MTRCFGGFNIQLINALRQAHFILDSGRKVYTAELRHIVCKCCFKLRYTCLLFSVVKLKPKKPIHRPRRRADSVEFIRGASTVPNGDKHQWAQPKAFHSVA